MRPLFTVHAGEYLVGNYLEEKYKNIRVWVPSKDTGIDILVTSLDCQDSVSLQVKFSKDYMGKKISKEIRDGIKSFGWWTFNRNNLKNNVADYWVMVLYQVQNRAYDFIVISPKDLLTIYNKLGRRNDTIHSYMWVTNKKPIRSWETRDLLKEDKFKIAMGQYEQKNRDLSSYLNNWNSIEKLNK